jgi:hypothetical protein
MVCALRRLAQAHQQPPGLSYPFMHHPHVVETGLLLGDNGGRVRSRHSWPLVGNAAYLDGMPGHSSPAQSIAPTTAHTVDTAAAPCQA